MKPRPALFMSLEDREALAVFEGTTKWVGER